MSSLHPDYDTSDIAIKNFATGNPHHDCRKFDGHDTMYLCYLALDRDRESAEAALDRLRCVIHTNETQANISHVYQTAMVVKFGSEDQTIRAAAQDLLSEMERTGLVPTSRDAVALSQTTGWPEMDALLRKVITDLTLVFGERMLSCYAVGSAFDGTGVPTSDIDLHLLFGGAHSSCLKNAVDGFAKELSRKYHVDLDLIPFFESDLNPWADVRTKLGGKHLFGDSSINLRLPPVEEYVPEMMHKAYFYLARVRRFPDSLSYPVSAPDSKDGFSGYVSRVHDDGSPSTKELAVVAGWISTALVTRAARCYIASKSASFAAYCERINDDWTSHLKDVFELVRRDWNYHVPETDEGRAKLEAICLRQIAFENHFLREYRKFLEQECSSPSVHHVERAQKLLGELFPLDADSASKPAGLLVPAWQLAIRRQEVDPRLTSPDHFIVKVPSLRRIDDKALRQAFQSFDDYGVVVFACKDSADMKYDLLALLDHFGEVILHPRSDKTTGISSVRNLFKPEAGFAGTTNQMQTAHTDGSFLADPPGIVALQTEICGLCGGESTLIFGDALYHYMQREHPAELETLFDDKAYKIGRGADEYTRTVFWRENDRINLAFRCGFGEHLEVSAKARRGFNLVYEYVNDPRNQLRFRLPGNHVLVVDNRRNLHGRLKWPPDTVRCLNRLWLDGAGSHRLYPGLGIRT